MICARLDSLEFNTMFHISQYSKDPVGNDTQSCECRRRLVSRRFIFYISGSLGLFSDGCWLSTRSGEKGVGGGKAARHVGTRLYKRWQLVEHTHVHHTVKNLHHPDIERIDVFAFLAQTEIPVRRKHVVVVQGGPRGIKTLTSDKLVIHIGGHGAYRRRQVCAGGLVVVAHDGEDVVAFKVRIPYSRRHTRGAGVLELKVWVPCIVRSQRGRRAVAVLGPIGINPRLDGRSGPPAELVRAKTDLVAGVLGRRGTPKLGPPGGVLCRYRVVGAHHPGEVTYRQQRVDVRGELRALHGV